HDFLDRVIAGFEEAFRPLDPESLQVIGWRFADDRPKAAAEIAGAPCRHAWRGFRRCTQSQDCSQGRAAPAESDDRRASCAWRESCTAAVCVAPCRSA